MKKHLLTLLSLSLLISGCAGEKKPEPAVSATLSEDGTSQSIDIAVKHGYAPSHIVAKPGVPLTLNFKRDESQGSCARELEIPSQNLSMTLPNRQTQTVKISAQPEGTEIPFQCSMDMMKGLIEFKDAPKASS